MTRILLLAAALLQLSVLATELQAARVIEFTSPTYEISELGALSSQPILLKCTPPVAGSESTITVQLPHHCEATIPQSRDDFQSSWAHRPPQSGAGMTIGTAINQYRIKANIGAGGRRSRTRLSSRGRGRSELRPGKPGDFTKGSRMV